MNAGMHRFTYWKEFSMGHEVCLEEIRQIRFLLHEKFQYRRELKSVSSPKE